MFYFRENCQVWDIILGSHIHLEISNHNPPIRFIFMKIHVASIIHIDEHILTFIFQCRFTKNITLQK